MSCDFQAMWCRDHNRPTSSCALEIRAELRQAKEFIKALILAHKATKSEDHYQITGDARRFIGLE